MGTDRETINELNLAFFWSSKATTLTSISKTTLYHPTDQVTARTDLRIECKP
jgi:hypothetical protein